MHITGHTQSSPWMYYLLQAFPEAIPNHRNVTESDFRFIINSSTDYDIILNGTPSYSSLDYISMREFTLTEITSTHVYSDNDSWESDVSYWC